MNAHDTLPDWNALSALGDDEVPLLQTALLIARDEYPDLDGREYAARVEEYALALRDEVDALDYAPRRIAAINRYLFEEIGFGGDPDDYYDPRNSYLNDVFDRRLGIPLTLALVQIEVARRLGLPLEGVSFPGHFLVRLPVGDGILVMDPFNRGRSLGADELKQRARPHMGGHAPDDGQLQQILEPASHRAILMRMLRNLKALYAEREDWDKVARSADRLLRLAPDTDDGLRDRGLAYLKLGHVAGARADLTRYLALAPEADDTGSVRRALVQASATRVRLN